MQGASMETVTDDTSVSEWFRDRNIFVTGGTGFMGKVLIYKLLFSCPNLGNIFILIRKKKEVDPQSRLQLLIQEEPFRIIREKYPERLKKLVLVSGDTTSDDLGLSAADKKRLLEEVSVVFHMAANVKFDLSLKEALTINTIGTRNVLNLAKQMTQLKAFMHVSTAFCQCAESVLEEKYYPCSISPEQVINTVCNLSDDVLHAITPKLLGGQPNTYAFTKALSEELVEKSGLPAGVVRPSIVTGSVREPAVGWVESLNGPTGFMIGAGKGVIRTLLCNYDNVLHLVPCDVAINVIIAATRKVGRESPERPIYVTASNSSENSISWGQSVDIGRGHTLTHPFTGILWYPGGSLTTIRFYHWIRVLFFQLLPAYVLDAIIVLTGNKPFLVRVQHRINNGMEVLEYYMIKDWEFRTDRMKKLELELNDADRVDFFMNMESISWHDYLLTYILGARQYCLKDDLSTLPRARQVLKYLYYADWFVKITLMILIGWLLYTWIEPFGGTSTTVFEVNEI